MAMRILVIGGTGLLGQHIGAELEERGHTVHAMARREVPGRTVVLGDAQRMSVDEWSRALEGFDAVVFAAGVDDRKAPRAPAEPHFHEGNVEPVRRLLDAARATGCGRAVVCGSYFATLNQTHPEWLLADRHPYIRSRVRQAQLAQERTEIEPSVAVLEIPFVFGSAPGRRPLWAPVVPWLGSRLPLLAPRGGTAVTTATTVAESAAGALEGSVGGRIPIADANLTWHDLFGRLASAAGRRPERAAVRRLPSSVLRTAIHGAGLRYRLTGHEPGLNSTWLADLLLSELFVDTSACRERLGVEGGDLDRAFHDTIVASRSG
ncbi:MAG TPA: NAD-dependent epimerase/dehydratase family protein, partial [Actinospica sp.]|nr:NAD-dependent epimerase/dehydratase family protein [Actinospica sp.]